MQRLTLGAVALGIALLVGIVSGRQLPAVNFVPEPSPLAIQVEDRNPWSSQPLNRGPRDFQFAIVTDRTGGRRPGIFTEAVRKLNLLQPEFVISVGDLIEGYSEDPAQIAIEWSEFQSKVQQLQMPFFYVPGNHDLANPKMLEAWQKKFGRTYYSFRYNDVLFLALNSEDPPKGEPYRFSAEQQQYVRETLANNKDVRWTFVFLHKPVWMNPDALEPSGWNAIEQTLSDRPYTVFAGHIHRYARFVRQGRDYIMLATTGGGSQLRGKQAGEIDQFVWVTVRGNEPVIANVLLDGIEDKAFRSEPEPRPTPKAQ
jgi:hypothetical protein